MDGDIAEKAALVPIGSDSRDTGLMADIARSSGDTVDMAEGVGRNSIFAQLVKSDTDISVS